MRGNSYRVPEAGLISAPAGPTPRREESVGARLRTHCYCTVKFIVLEFTPLVRT
jgi:hypothetical protein